MDFWQTYGLVIGILLIIGAIYHPRIAMLVAVAVRVVSMSPQITLSAAGVKMLVAKLFALVTDSGWLWVVGLVIAPHLTVAILAIQQCENISLWLRFALYIGAIWGTLYDLVNVATRLCGDDPKTKQQLEKIKSKLLMVPFGLALAPLYVGLGVAVIIAVLIILYGAGMGIFVANAVIVGTVIILGLGFVFYSLRKNHRFWYGVFEVLSAVTLGGFTIFHSVSDKDHSTYAYFINAGSTEGVTRILALLTSIYIVVRGLDNIDEGKSSKAPQPLFESECEEHTL